MTTLRLRSSKQLNGLLVHPHTPLLEWLLFCRAPWLGSAETEALDLGKASHLPNQRFERDSLICSSWFHAAYGHAFYPFEREFLCPLGHCHPLPSASHVHHGFTEYTVGARPSAEAKVQCPVGHHHTLSSPSCAIRGFTRHRLVLLPRDIGTSAYRDIGISGHQDIGTSGYWDIWTSGYRDIRISGYRDTGILGYWDVGISGYRGTKVWNPLGHPQTLPPTSCVSHGWT